MSPESVIGSKLRFSSGIVKQSMGKYDDALIDFLSLIIQSSKSKQKVQEIDASGNLSQSGLTKEQPRELLAIQIASHYWAAYCYRKKKQFDECIKYCKIGIDLFEIDLEKYESDKEFRNYYAEICQLEVEAERDIDKYSRIQSNLTEITSKHSNREE